ncbi:MAG: hypothetical protein HQK50_01880 [Oligoflexia bacterium]|nr:hypothetical protein [Oligoflexia bacterium]MBF0364287.1 hypothetical protein [Oligoflexia bacterium]
MMDPQKVSLKFKKNAKGSHTIAYCDEYPSVQGIGPSEGQAVANFWKAFNVVEDKAEHAHTLEKKAALVKEKENGNEHEQKNNHYSTKKRAA